MAVNRRIFFGAIVMFVVLVITGELETADLIPRFQLIPGLVNSPTYNLFIFAFVAAGTGAYIARDRFLIPAVLIMAVYWGLVVNLLYAILRPLGQYTFFEVALHALPHLLLGLVGSALGAFTGLRFYLKFQDREETIT